MTSPTLNQTSNIGITNDNTPSFTFTSDQPGTITSSLTFTSTTSAINGTNTITFDTLSDATYNSETVTVTNSSNESTSFTINSFTIDTTAPTLSSVSLASNNSTNTLAKADDVVTLTFTASETINTPTVTFLSGGQAINDTSITYNNTSGNTWTAAYTVNSSDTDGSVTYSIAFRDLSGNNGTAVTSGSGSVTVNTTTPTLSSVSLVSDNSTNTLAKENDVVTLTFIASETINTPTVTFLSGGQAISDTSITYNNTSGNTWTAAYTVNSSDTDGSVTYSIAFSDLTGNNGTAVISGSGSVTVDTITPTCTISSSTVSSGGYTNSSSISLTFTLSESSSNFVDGDISVTNGTLSSFSGSGTSYSATFTPSSDGSCTIDVDANTFTDTSGNNNSAATQYTFTYDTTVPTLSSVSLASNNSTNTLAKANDVVTLTFTASETINTPTVTFLSGGQAINDTSITYNNISGNTWTAAYTVNSSDTDGSVTYSIAFSDLANNNGTAVTSGSGSVTVDTTTPTLSSVSLVSDNSTNTLAKANDVVTLTFTASETINTPTVTFLSGGQAINDTSITYTNTSGNTWTAAYTVNSSDTDGSVTYSIAFSDLTGNNGTAVTSGSGSVTIDTTEPTAAITYSPSRPYKENDSVTITATFSESMKDSPIPQISISGIESVSATNMTKSTSTIYTYIYTVPSGDGTGTISLSNGQDLTGNTITSTPTSGSTFTVDNTAPTLSSVSLVSDNSTNTLAKANDIVTLTFTASETINTPTVTFLSGGQAINDTSITYNNTSGNTWTAAYTVNSSDTDGSVTYSIAFSDLANNNGTTVTSGSGSVTIDTTLPTLSSVSIASNNSTNTLAKANDIVTLTFTASETINTPTVTFLSGGQAINDTSITYNNTSGNTWTAAYTVNSSDTDGSVTYSISFNDLAGNNGTAVTSGSGSVTIDNTSPTLSSVSLVSYNSTNTLAKANNVVTLTFTASETINTPTVTFLSGGQAINDTSITYTNTSGNTWTAAYTVNSSDTDGSVTYSIAFSDLTGNNGTAVTSGSGSVTVDTTLPTLSSVSIISNNSTNTLAKADDVVTLTFTSSETINTPTVTFLSGGQAINDTSITYTNTSGNTWTAAYTVNSSDTDGSVTYSIAFSDLTGNNGIAVTSGSGTVTIDTTSPTISIVIGNLPWGSNLNNTESDSDQTITATTSGAEDGQTVTFRLNSINYTGTVSSNSASTTISSSALKALSDDSTYTITANVSDAAGNAATESSISFTTDFTNPTLLVTYPANNNLGISIKTRILLTFNELIYAGSSGNVTIKQYSNDSTIQTINISANSSNFSGFGSSKIVITLITDLSNSTKYYINIDSTVFKDANNNFYAGISNNSSFVFTTTTSGVSGSRITREVDNSSNEIIDKYISNTNTTQFSTGLNDSTDKYTISSGANLTNNQLITVSTAGNMDVTGAFTCGEFSVSSDIRIKENIQKIENILPKINQIRGVSYNLRIDKYKKKHIGFIAQEVEEIFPELVRFNDEKGIKTINYAQFNTILLEGIKEMNVLINNMSNKINDLENEVKELKNKNND